MSSTPWYFESMDAAPSNAAILGDLYTWKTKKNRDHGNIAGAILPPGPTIHSTIESMKFRKRMLAKLSDSRVLTAY